MVIHGIALECLFQQLVPAVGFPVDSKKNVGKNLAAAISQGCFNQHFVVSSTLLYLRQTCNYNLFVLFFVVARG